MPIAIATKIEESDSDIDQVTPPTPYQSLPKLDEKHIEEQKPTLEMNEKSELNVMDEKEQVRQQRQAEIDEAMRKIRMKRDELTAAAKPYALKTRNFAENQPMIFTFLAIFSFLSIVPIGVFIGFIVSATAFILGTAIVGICLSLLTCILIGASILLPILVFTTSVSAFIVTGLVSLFLLQRFYLHLYATLVQPTGYVEFSSEAVSKGVRNWLTEIESRAWLPPLPERISPRAQKVDLPSPTLDEIDEKKAQVSFLDNVSIKDNKTRSRGRSPLNHNKPAKVDRSLNGASPSLNQ